MDYGRGARVDLTQWLQRGIPVIVFVRTDFLEYWETDIGHAIVVVGMNDEQVHVHDPVMEKGPVSISAISFDAAWTEMDYGCAIITPESNEIC